MNDSLSQERPRGLDLPKLTVGLFLVALGLAFLFDRLFWWDAHTFFRLWPLWLIGFGLVRVLYPRRGRSRLAGFSPIAIGGIFLMDALDVVHIHDSWPLFIVIGGIMMVFRSAGLGGCAHRGRPRDEGARS